MRKAAPVFGRLNAPIGVTYNLIDPSQPILNGVSGRQRPFLAIANAGSNPVTYTVTMHRAAVGSSLPNASEDALFNKIWNLMEAPQTLPTFCNNQKMSSSSDVRWPVQNLLNLLGEVYNDSEIGQALLDRMAASSWKFRVGPYSSHAGLSGPGTFVVNLDSNLLEAIYFSLENVYGAISVIFHEIFHVATQLSVNSRNYQVGHEYSSHAEELAATFIGGQVAGQLWGANTPPFTRSSIYPFVDVARYYISANLLVRKGAIFAGYRTETVGNSPNSRPLTLVTDQSQLTTGNSVNNLFYAKLAMQDLNLFNFANGAFTTQFNTFFRQFTFGDVLTPVTPYAIKQATRDVVMAFQDNANIHISLRRRPDFYWAWNMNSDGTFASDTWRPNFINFSSNPGGNYYDYSRIAPPLIAPPLNLSSPAPTGCGTPR